MNQQNPLPFEQFAASIALNEQQTEAVKQYIIGLLVDNLVQMKNEYNQEIDQAMKNLSGNSE